MLLSRWTSPALASVLLLSACASEPDTAPETDEPVVQEPVSQEEMPEGTPVTEASAKLNLNLAPVEAFEALPNVGDRMAHEFDEYRPYVSIQEFRREMAKYVEDDAIVGYEQYVFVPIDPNASDAETVAQLPGVDLAEATQILEARPFESDVAFLAALEPFVTPEEQEEAADYLVTE